MTASTRILAGSSPHSVSVEIDSPQVQDILPHRGSALLVTNMVTVYNEAEPYRARTNLTVTDEHCAGHFGVMPGHLMTEAAAQLTGVLAHYYIGARGSGMLRRECSEFRAMAQVGDRLTITVTLTQHRKRGTHHYVTATGVVVNQEGTFIAEFPEIVEVLTVEDHH